VSPVRKESIFSQRIIADHKPRFSRSAAKFASLSARDFRRVKVSELLYWLAANKILKRPRYGPGRDSEGRLVMHYDENRILDEADGMIQRIKRGELDPADSANHMVDYMRESRLANNTILMARHTILRFLRYSRLGLDYYDLNLAVKKVPRVWENLKRTPTREEVMSILLACDLRIKTLFSMLISTGARMGGILTARKDRD